MSILTVICNIEKTISIFKKFARNSNQSDFDLLVDYTYAKIMIVPAMDSNFFGRQDNAVMQSAGQSPEQLFYCGNVGFSYFSLLNHKSLACPIDKVL